jgi:hypothetical protein
MRQPVLLAIVMGILVAFSAACGASVDLSKLAVAESFTGWYDNGVKDGRNHLVPSISFKLQNTGTSPANEVQVVVSFWRDGDDGEYDGKEVRGLGAEALSPGASSAPILVRAEHGYTLEQPRAELFTHSGFKDVTAKILAKRDGRVVRLADVKIDRRIIPRLAAGAASP